MEQGSPRVRWGDFVAGAAVVAAVALVSVFVFSQLRYEWDWAAAWEHRSLFLQGWGLTLVIAGGALLLSLVVAVALVFGLRAPSRVVRWTCRSFVEIVRGTPLLVQILIGYYIVANAFAVSSPVVTGILLLSAFGGAYLAEILRGGVESIGKSQLESARAVGFDRFQIYRYVIVPQAVRRVLPGAVGVFVMLIKDSSLLSVIGIEELTRMAKNVGSRTYGQLEAYVPMAVGYLVLTIPVAAFATYLERRFAFDS